MKLIVICGVKRSGKDTSADYIVDNWGAEKYNLANPIKEALAYAYAMVLPSTLGYNDFNGEGIDREKNLQLCDELVRRIFIYALKYLDEFYLSFNWDGVREGVRNIVLNTSEPWTIRRLMQALGTDIVVDGIDKMYWMKLFSHKYLEAIASGKKYFIVPDTRQEHEIETFRSMGATVIHVVRPSNEIKKDLHITEAGLKIHDDDTVIVNDQDLNSLYAKLEEIKNV